MIGMELKTCDWCFIFPYHYLYCYIIISKIVKAAVPQIHSISVACVWDKFAEYRIPNHSEVELPIIWDVTTLTGGSC